MTENKPRHEPSYCISIANQHHQHTQQTQHSSTQQRSAQLTFSSLSQKNGFQGVSRLRRFLRLFVVVFLVVFHPRPYN